MVTTRVRPAVDSDRPALNVFYVDTGRLEPDGDPFSTWAVEGTLALISQVRQLLLSPDATNPACVAVVCTSSVQTDPYRRAAVAALREALRGTVGALTLELGPTLRLNLVFAQREESTAVGETLDLLAGPLGGFIAGSTFELEDGE